MAQYIDKTALVAEIDNILDYIDEHWDTDYAIGAQRFADKLQDAIDTLEVKEVDLDFQRFAKEMDAIFALPSSETKNTEEEPLNWEYAIAKQFFDLGMRASNPITPADRGTAEEIIISLKRVEEVYRIDLTREIEWLRNKVKKGKRNEA